MPAISLSSSSVVKGERIALRLALAPDVDYGQMQVQVFTAGEANPSNALGFGTIPQHPADGELAVDIDTQHLRAGIYEIGLVRLHSPTAPTATRNSTWCQAVTSRVKYSRFANQPTRQEPLSNYGHMLSNWNKSTRDGSQPLSM